MAVGSAVTARGRLLGTQIGGCLRRRCGARPRGASHPGVRPRCGARDAGDAHREPVLGGAILIAPCVAVVRLRPRRHVKTSRKRSGASPILERRCSPRPPPSRSQARLPGTTSPTAATPAGGCCGGATSSGVLRLHDVEACALRCHSFVLYSARRPLCAPARGADDVKPVGRAALAESGRSAEDTGSSARRLRGGIIARRFSPTTSQRSRRHPATTTILFRAGGCSRSSAPGRRLAREANRAGNTRSSRTSRPPAAVHHRARRRLRVGGLSFWCAGVNEGRAHASLREAVVKPPEPSRLRRDKPGAIVGMGGGTHPRGAMMQARTGMPLVPTRSPNRHDLCCGANSARSASREMQE